MKLHPWQRPVNEAEDTTSVSLGVFAALGNGYLLSLRPDQANLRSVNYALPVDQSAPAEFQYAVRSITHNIVACAVRQLGGPRNAGSFAPLPTTELVRIYGGRLLPATAEEVAANV